MKRQINIKNNSSVLKEQKQDSELFNMTLRGIPTSTREKFKELKGQGKVSGSMNSYIINSLIKQLQRDEQ